VYSSISLPSGRWLEGRKTKNAGLLWRALFLMQADDCLVPTQKRCTTQLQHRDGCFHYFLGWATLWSTADLLRSVPFLLAACCGVGFAPRTRRSCCFLFVLVCTWLFFLLSPLLFSRFFFRRLLSLCRSKSRRLLDMLRVLNETELVLRTRMLPHSSSRLEHLATTTNNALALLRFFRRYFLGDHVNQSDAVRLLELFLQCVARVQENVDTHVGSGIVSATVNEITTKMTTSPSPNAIFSYSPSRAT
jgi:hypothetical protein